MEVLLVSLHAPLQRRRPGRQLGLLVACFDAGPESYVSQLVRAPYPQHAPKQEYNFRFEMEDGKQIQGHKRFLEGSVREKNDKRKRQRHERKERKDAEKIRRTEELKRLKNLKKQEIMRRLKQLQEATSGSGMRRRASDKGCVPRGMVSTGFGRAWPQLGRISTLKKESIQISPNVQRPQMSAQRPVWDEGFVLWGVPCWPAREEGASMLEI